MTGQAGDPLEAESDRKRAASRFGAHMRAGEPVRRYDIGDSLARKRGVLVVPVVCGKANVLTTLTTKSADRVGCPECLDLLARPGEESTAP